MSPTCHIPPEIPCIPVRKYRSLTVTILAQVFFREINEVTSVFWWDTLSRVGFESPLNVVALCTTPSIDWNADRWSSAGRQGRRFILLEIDKEKSSVVVSSWFQKHHLCWKTYDLLSLLQIIGERMQLPLRFRAFDRNVTAAHESLISIRNLEKAGQLKKFLVRKFESNPKSPLDFAKVRARIDPRPTLKFTSNT